MTSAASTRTDSTIRKPRGPRPRVGKDDIVTAALHLFARRGYRGTTLAAIADAIGVTDAAVLHYFDTKAAILEAVLAEDDAAGKDDFLRLIEPGGVEAVRRLSEWAARMEAHPETTSLQVVLSAEALGEGSELHGRFEERYRYTHRQLEKAIQRGIDDGSVNPYVDASYEATALLVVDQPPADLLRARDRTHRRPSVQPPRSA
jgi:AcrR family transcriptional regulator